ncbi:MAG TPA: hypothetical protein VLQ89_08925, partial [Candidatus Binatia bacterium]|nr:hypothetical protein [Candidatus Binatia bacterium]
MKFLRFYPVLLLLLAGLIFASCVTVGDGDGEGDDSNPPNFVNETCGGCPTEEYIGSVTAIRFFSYVKNIGGSGKISMTIGTGGASATQEFDVTAGTSYVFTASVPVEASASSSFTYQALFPGTAGYTDAHTVNGFRVTGSPYDLQM